jgi:hypothetical protein
MFMGRRGDNRRMDAKVIPTPSPGLVLDPVALMNAAVPTTRMGRWWGPAETVTSWPSLACSARRVDVPSATSPLERGHRPDRMVGWTSPRTETMASAPVVTRVPVGPLTSTWALSFAPASWPTSGLLSKGRRSWRDRSPVNGMPVARSQFHPDSLGEW